MSSDPGPGPGRWRWPGAVLPVLLAAAVAAGCGGGEPEDAGKRPASPQKTAQPEVPPGFTPAAAGPVRLAHPPAWKPAKPPKGWSFLAELADNGEVEARIGVITDVPQIPNAKLVTESAITVVQFNLGNVQRGPNREIDVPGADEAFRVDYSYPNPQARAGTVAGAPVRAVDIGVIIGDRQSAVVRLTGLQNKLTQALVDQIVRSVAVKA
ncbi:hypothetical protein [Actinomadura sp. 6K520]|uniref:hypothetical protein n=1 Tax=Actinomadura sp. 6K520 TaxID=2530364 RepID=UPI00104FB649|nr:hypothetical protein [Actinomadura sp. 6K520]TDE26554.1 hypothetical protein E1289_25180 [Actinomadura sp. 6K520]